MLAEFALLHTRLMNTVARNKLLVALRGWLDVDDVAMNTRGCRSVGEELFEEC
jgi:hypothetical protein